MQLLKIKTKLSLHILFILAVLSNGIFAQGITISSGTTLTGGSATVTLPGNWNNSGTFNPDVGTILFNGSGGNQTITNLNGENFYSVIINKSSGNLQLLNSIAVSNSINFISGDLDLNGSDVSLGSTGTIYEIPGNTIVGTSGSISASNPDFNATSSYDMGGLGASITSSANLGSTTITRGNYAQTGAGNSGIKRFYIISPANNSGLNASLTFSYDESELNGIAENDLTLYRSADGGNTWTDMGGSVVPANNFVNLSGIDAFSMWTLGGNTSPLPVELTSFKANNVDGMRVELNWVTATEINTYGFEVNRAMKVTHQNGESEELQWENVGFEEGSGNSNKPQRYTFVDVPDGGTKFIYRLKMIDNDGSFEYSDQVEIEIIPKKYELSQNYPNPFNPTTKLKYSIPIDSKVTLKLYDILGRDVAELVNEKQTAGRYVIKFDASKLSSGVYFYHLNVVSGSKQFSQVRKMVLLR